jgi:hypothetical protein
MECSDGSQLGKELPVPVDMSPEVMGRRLELAGELTRRFWAYMKAHPDGPRPDVSWLEKSSGEVEALMRNPPRFPQAEQDAQDSD